MTENIEAAGCPVDIEEAEKKAREFRKSLQEDVDNWYDNIMAGAIDR